VARVSGGQAKRLRDRSRVAIQLAVVLWSMGPAVRENASPYRLFRRFLAAATSLSTLGGSFVHAGQRTYALYGVQPMRSNSSQAWAASTAATRSDGGRHLPHIASKRPPESACKLGTSGARASGNGRSRAAGAALEPDSGGSILRPTTPGGRLRGSPCARTDAAASDRVLVRLALILARAGPGGDLRAPAWALRRVVADAALHDATPELA
jgi:hypothetical protein